MQPVRTETSNFTYRGPLPDIADLPCEVDARTVTAVFKLTQEEREEIAAGGYFSITIHQRPMPPISVGTTGPGVEKWEADDLRCNGCGAVWKEDRGLDHCGHCGQPLFPATFATPE